MAIKEPLSIIGYGASTINGTSAEMTYAMQQADQKFFKKHEVITDFDDNPVTVATAGYIEEKEDFINRYIILGTNALKDSISLLDPKKDQRILLLVGIPEKRGGLPDDLEEKLKEKFEEILEEFLDVQIKFFRGKHAICAQIIEGIAEEVKENTICIIGGIDSYQSYQILSKMRENKELLTVENKYGIIASEGAGFIVFTNPNNQQKLGLEPFADIVDVLTEEEKESFSKGKALTKVMKRALGKLPKDTKCERILHDLIKRDNSLELGCSYVRMPKLFSDYKTMYRLPGNLGDVGTATIPLLVINAIEEARWGDEESINPLLISLTDKVKAGILLKINRFIEVESYKIA